MSISPIEASRRRRPSRDALVERFMALAPTVRRGFDVRLGQSDRSEWLSLTGHQLEALTALEEGSLTMRSLCERLEISESAGTALSDRLVARGMVAREPDPADRRVVRLALTGDARSMVERYRATKRARVTEVLSALDRDDLERLVTIYETLAAAGTPADEQPTSGAPADGAPRRSAATRSRRKAPAATRPTDRTTTHPGASA